ncbi:hypothetical protein BD779DRAFT_1681324 [Infundibulicybe gibba]|nr:hypothetical protein BD779DRAFT_1681324 [Infundibulicybe gibba]
MPGKYEKRTPCFDPDQPHSLCAYFKDLCNLLEEAKIDDLQIMKEKATKYVGHEVAELWEGLASYKTGPYEDFTKAVIALYPGASEDKHYSVKELEQMVMDQSQSPITSVTELAAYYRNFKLASMFLMGKLRLSTREESHNFARGLPTKLWNKVLDRLDATEKYQSRAVDDLPSTKDINNAAKYILQCAQSVSITPIEPRSIAVSSDDMTTLVSQFVTLLKSVQANAQTPVQMPTASPTVSMSYSRQPPKARGCNFCGANGHWMAGCDILSQYINNSKVRRRSGDNFLILGTGAEIPDGRGRSLKEHVDAWHHSNANQQASTQLSSNADTPHQVLMSVVVPSTPVVEKVPGDVQILQRDTLAVATWSRQLFDGVMRGAHPSLSLRLRQRLSHAVGCTSSMQEVEGVATFLGGPTLHVGASDAGALPLEAGRGGTPKQEPNVADKVVWSILATKIELTIGDLFTASPLLHATIKDIITPHRGGSTDNNMAARMLDELDKQFPEEPSQPVDPPANLIANDIFLAHIRDSPPENTPVAKESHTLRAVPVLVDGKETIAAIGDPGLQIIAIPVRITTEDVMVNLGLVYDKNIQLNMQLANGIIDRSLGLVRNVPISVGDIKLYMQIHVIRNPTYDLLLGRPFDVLTCSIIKNFSNEEQMITIQEPDTPHFIEIPTVPC